MLYCLLNFVMHQTKIGVPDPSLVYHFMLIGVDGVVDLLSVVRVAKVWPTTLSQITDINALGVENMNLPLNKLHYDNITKEISKLII